MGAFHTLPFLLFFAISISLIIERICEHLIKETNVSNGSFLLESDFTTDCLRWIGKCNEYKLGYPKANPNKLKKISEDILSSNDYALAYFFAYDYDFNKHLMQNLIIQNQNVKYAYLFARDIAGADISALQKIVSKSNDVKYISKFAAYVNGADFKSLEKDIIASGVPQYIHLLIKTNKISNVDLVKEIIMKTGKPRYLFALAKRLSSKEDLEKIEDLIIESRCLLYMRLFAQKIKLANVRKIEKEFIKFADEYDIKKFGRLVKGSKIKDLLVFF